MLRKSNADMDADSFANTVSGMVARLRKTEMNDMAWLHTLVDLNLVKSTDRESELVAKTEETAAVAGTEYLDFSDVLRIPSYNADARRLYVRLKMLEFIEFLLDEKSQHAFIENNQQRPIVTNIRVFIPMPLITDIWTMCLIAEGLSVIPASISARAFGHRAREFLKGVSYMGPRIDIVFGPANTRLSPQEVAFMCQSLSYLLHFLSPVTSRRPEGATALRDGERTFHFGVNARDIRIKNNEWVETVDEIGKRGLAIVLAELYRNDKFLIPQDLSASILRRVQARITANAREETNPVPATISAASASSGTLVYTPAPAPAPAASSPWPRWTKFGTSTWRKPTPNQEASLIIQGGQTCNRCGKKHSLTNQHQTQIGL